jgi:hypothetical protein
MNAGDRRERSGRHGENEKDHRERSGDHGENPEYRKENQRGPPLNPDTLEYLKTREPWGTLSEIKPITRRGKRKFAAKTWRKK